MTSEEFHIELEQAGHKLIREEDGRINIWVLDSGIHNGLGCELCGESWCQHCQRPIVKCDVIKR